MRKTETRSSSLDPPSPAGRVIHEENHGRRVSARQLIRRDDNHRDNKHKSHNKHGLSDDRPVDWRARWFVAETSIKQQQQQQQQRAPPEQEEEEGEEEDEEEEAYSRVASSPSWKSRVSGDARK